MNYLGSKEWMDRISETLELDEILERVENLYYLKNNSKSLDRDFIIKLIDGYNKVIMSLI